MEWEAPAIVLQARPYGEADVIATLMTEEHGLHRGLVRGGLSRAQTATWQAGNLVAARWTARLSDQLGSFRGEPVHATAALAMSDPLALGIVTAACEVAEAALPEREPHPAVFEGLLRLLVRVSSESAPVPDFVRWEMRLLADLGYGIDLRACAVSGATAGLAYVSPRTGRAVTAEAAGAWAGRLLRLPSFLVGGNAAGPGEWQDGLRLTGHFLARDAFGQHNRALPLARQMLYDRVAALAVDADQQTGDHDAE